MRWPGGAQCLLLNLLYLTQLVEGRKRPFEGGEGLATGTQLDHAQSPWLQPLRLWLPTSASFLSVSSMNSSPYGLRAWMPFSQGLAYLGGSGQVEGAGCCLLPQGPATNRSHDGACCMAPSVDMEADRQETQAEGASIIHGSALLETLTVAP